MTKRVRGGRGARAVTPAEQYAQTGNTAGRERGD